MSNIKIILIKFWVPIEIRTRTEGSTNPSANHYTIGTIYTLFIIRALFSYTKFMVGKSSECI